MRALVPNGLHEFHALRLVRCRGRRLVTIRVPLQSSTGCWSISCLAHTIAFSSVSHTNARKRSKCPSEFTKYARYAATARLLTSATVDPASAAIRSVASLFLPAWPSVRLRRGRDQVEAIRLPHAGFLPRQLDAFREIGSVRNGVAPAAQRCSLLKSEAGARDGRSHHSCQGSAR